jgi:hypothetical protein
VKTNSRLATQVETPNQINLRRFIIRRLKLITRAIALAQCLVLMLAVLAATAQSTPAATATATNATVSPAEVEAFIKEIKQGTNGAMPSYMSIPANPKRVPLLLAVIEREPTGPWAHYLQGFCFGVEHGGAFRLPPASRLEFYVRAIEYLTTAKTIVSKAFAADPQNRRLKDNLGTLDAGLALAYVESGTRTKEVLTIAEALLASNTVTNWNYGNLIYDMHSLLGRIALRGGDVAGAKRHLLESSKSKKSKSKCHSSLLTLAGWSSDRFVHGAAVADTIAGRNVSSTFAKPAARQA